MFDPKAAAPAKKSLSSGKRWPARVAIGAILVSALSFAVYLTLSPEGPRAQITMRSSETLVTAVRSLARLETASMRLQKVVDLKDEQTRLWGMVRAEDGILLIAAADVRAGVDLSGLEEQAITTREEGDRVILTLPRAEIFSVALDNQETYVYSRSTDALARHNPQLETRARAAAEEMLRKSALESDLTDLATQNAEHLLRALLRSLGHNNVEFRWMSPGAETPPG